jgi:hypothetical protein
LLLLQRNVRPFDSRMYETDSTSLARFRDRLIVYSLLLQTLAFQVEILVAHVPLGSWLFREDVCNWPSKRQVKIQLLHRSCSDCQVLIVGTSGESNVGVF